MEMETMSSVVTCNKDEDDDVPLPGFRFHPTDEELVGFYLKRKVEKRPISIELIKQIDIYKFDPWDLPSKFCFTSFTPYFLSLWTSFFFFFSSPKIH